MSPRIASDVITLPPLLPLSLSLLLASSVTQAEAPSRTRGVFFGLSVGAGVAWIDHTQISREPQGGATWDVVLGWRLASRWSLGVALTTWQTSFLGTPAHLHTLAPRVELHPYGGDGLFLVGAFGLAMVDGDVSKRAGLGATLAVGYRFALNRFSSLAVQAGSHAQWQVFYGEGAALQPFVGLELRFHGRTGR